MRVLLALALLLLAACGGTRTDAVEPAAPKTIELGWREVGRPPAPRIVFSVRRLVIERHGWRAEIGFRNESGETLVLTRRHRLTGSMLGLVVGRPSNPILVAARVHPPPPRVLRPGEGWNGTIGGFRSLPRGALVRVAFGRFVSYGLAAAGGRAARFVWVTEHAVRV